MATRPGTDLGCSAARPIAPGPVDPRFFPDFLADEQGFWLLLADGPHRAQGRGAQYSQAEHNLLQREKRTMMYTCAPATAWHTALQYVLL